MSELNLPSIELKLRSQDNKDYVFDRLRRLFIRLTPEEYVRQLFVHFLIEYRHFPEALLANEVEIKMGNVKKRCDTILYDQFLKPLMIVEYKSPKIKISQATFDQIARYNMKLQVPWLVVSNGIHHYCCKIDYQEGNYSFVKEIPDYSEILLTPH